MFSIVVDADFVAATERLSPSTQRPLCTSFYVRIGGEAFPNSQWDDFAIAILSSWAENVSQIKMGIAPEATLRFMDGPFQLLLHADEESGTCLLSGVKRSAEGEEVLCHDTVPLDTVFNEILRASEIQLNAMEQASRWDADCSRLEVAIVDLRSVLGERRGPPIIGWSWH